MHRRTPDALTEDARDPSTASVDAELVARTAERDRLWDLSPDLLTVVDYSGRLLRINPSWMRVLGHDEDFLLSGDYDRILHSEEVPRIRALLIQMKTTQRPTRLQNRMLTSDGTWRTFVWTLSPEPGEDRFYGIGRDVTDEQRQADALAARTAERDQLWTLSADMLARADYTGMMLAVSPAWNRLLGFSEGELLSRPYSDFMHPDDTEETLAALVRMGETGSPVRFENRILTSRGDYKPIGWTVVPDPDGDTFIAIGRDFTEARQREDDLKQMQSALLQSQKLEALGQLTGGVAHDFNNLLTAVMSNLDLLSKRLAGDARAARLIDGAMQGAQRGATLTQRMLAFARRQDLTVEPRNLAHLVERAEGLLRQSVGNRIDLRLDLSRSVPLALVDDNQFDLALLNLVLNARDAMPAGGTMTVCVDHHPSEQPQHGHVRLIVSDTGHGMDPETLDKATQPFFTTKGVGKGSGLGLSMIHGLALQLNGQLRLESAVGRGTRAELWLPATEMTATDAQPATSCTVAGNGATRSLRILMVDDDALIAMSTVDMLEDLGHAVTSAYSGTKALDILRSEAVFDLLITDFSMPRMNGGQLAREARKLRPTLPILLATGYAELPEDDDLRLPRLAKPYLQQQLQAEIDRIVPR
ncbi:PAS domain-containing sensor histidine kinase [Paracoccus liaowanqingii]|uniref:histidine kinase n=1 Tax=Paracoccus liaowanqingii TaxID=2560053 RepID=A0A4Z1CBS5_9RHOB|nr:PAS domain-containing sensor histidine kinase [Paracoccus liaowanqingii]TGN62195.1 PAS domain-containing sensor histidine kinase [Paracoccus liaowanqingii]